MINKITSFWSKSSIFTQLIGFIWRYLYLEDVNFESVFNTKDPNEAFEKFYKILYTNLENLVPKKRIGCVPIHKKKYPDWWSRDTISLCKKKEFIWKKKKKQLLQTNTANYKTIKKQCNALIKTDFKNYTKDLQIELKNIGKKEFWNYIKSRSKNSNNLTYKCNNQIISDPKTICNEFAAYFNSVYSEPSSYDYNQFSSIYSNELPMFSVSLEDVSKAIRDLPEKSAGIDSLPPKLFKTCHLTPKRVIHDIFQFPYFTHFRHFSRSVKTNISDTYTESWKINRDWKQPTYFLHYYNIKFFWDMHL